MATLLSSFLLVALSEMGDKTQLLAFSLSARFRSPWPIMGGILVATLLNHGLASSVGSWVSAQIPTVWLSGGLGLTFLAFGIWTLKPDTLEGKPADNKYGAFVTTAVLFFLAEIGDKTQFATVALAAKFQSIFWVTAGTTLGMLVSDGLAVFAGEKLSHRLNMNWMRGIAAVLFFLFGILSLLKAGGIF